MARTKKQNFQFFRRFYMKGCLYRIKGIITELINIRYVTESEKLLLMDGAKIIDNILVKFDDHSEELKP